MWQIEFESADFLPFLPEECQANPGVYGFELALWLSQALAKRGLVTSYPIGEDWGWFIEHVHGDVALMIGCSSLTEEGDGYAGTPIGWGVFVEPRLSLPQRLRGVSAEPAVERLAVAVEEALKEHGIRPRPPGEG